VTAFVDSPTQISCFACITYISVCCYHFQVLLSHLTNYIIICMRSFFLLTVLFSRLQDVRRPVSLGGKRMRWSMRRSKLYRTGRWETCCAWNDLNAATSTPFSLVRHPTITWCRQYPAPSRWTWYVSTCTFVIQSYINSE